MPLTVNFIEELYLLFLKVLQLDRTVRNIVVYFCRFPL